MTHMPFGHACVTYRVEAGSEAFILKTSGAMDAFKYTLSHIRTLESLGVPVPGEPVQGNREGVEFLAYRMIPGRDLRYELPTMSRAQMTRLAERIVEIQRAVATLPTGEGFGWTPLGCPGPFASWLDVLARDSTGCPEPVARQVRLIERYLRDHPATCFLDDLTVKNVIVRDGELQGIVDLDFFCYGDPMYMVSLAQTTVVLDVGFDALFYTDEIRRLWGLSPEQERALDVYGAVQGWSFLTRDAVASESLRRIERWVDGCLARLAPG